MKQLGLGFVQYIQDYDGSYPGAGAKQKWADGGHWITGGTTAPQNYGDADPALTSNTAPFGYNAPHHAFADKGALYPYIKSTQIYVCPSTPDGQEKQLSYSMNCALGFTNEARWDETASLVLLVDEDKTLNDGYFWATLTGNAASTDALTKTHLEGGNLLFSDGHVKFFPFARFPLDNSAIGINNKKARTGSPRFHDAADDSCP